MNTTTTKHSAMRQLTFEKYMLSKGYEVKTQACAMLSSAECFDSARIAKVADGLLAEFKNSSIKLAELYACLVYKSAWIKHNCTLSIFGGDERLTNEYHDVYQHLAENVGNTIKTLYPMEYDALLKWIDIVFDKF